MKSWILRFLLGLFGLTLIWLLVIRSGVLPRPSAEQTAALDLLRAPPAAAQARTNAFELFWLLDYDVPADQRATVVAEDAAALRAKPATAEADLPSRRAGRFPLRVAKDAARSERCAPDCLTQVRKNPEQWRLVLSAQQPRLAALRALGDYDHYASPFPPDFAVPIPSFRDTSNLVLAEAALAHLDGRSDAALAGLCRDLGQWRRLKGHSDSLLTEMLTVALIQAGVRLVSDIRAELPREYALPLDCATALAAPNPEQRLGCAAIRSEFAMIEHAVETLGSGQLEFYGDVRDRAAPWLVNGKATAAVLAPGYAELCRLSALPVAQWPKPALDPVDCNWQQHLFNPAGCELAGIAVPNFRDYLLRDRDAEAALRVLALADWLAAQPDPSAAFAARPAEYADIEQALSFAQGEVSMTLFKPRGDDPPLWPLPLPGSRLPEPPPATETSTP